MTHWHPKQPNRDDDLLWATEITKVAIERLPIGDGDPYPWFIWGRNYNDGSISEDVWEFETFAAAIAAVPSFWAAFEVEAAKPVTYRMKVELDLVVDSPLKSQDLAAWDAEVQDALVDLGYIHSISKAQEV